MIKEQISDMKNGNFTEEEVENAKRTIISSINMIDDEQETGIMYYCGQEMSRNQQTIDEYIERIQQVTNGNIMQVAEKIEINTVYFLRN